MCEPCENTSNVPQQLIEALTCCICQEVTTLPVHGTCCQRAKSLQPACLCCVRKWYQQNRVPSQRSTSVKSFGGCGCEVYLNGNNKLYEHSVQLDMVRNLVGQSVCFHERCGARFDTCEELRRHVQGRATKTDKFGNCQEAITKCPHCSFFGKRCIVERSHYQEHHKKVFCTMCKSYVYANLIKAHFSQHVKELHQEKREIAILRNTVNARDKNFKKNRELLDIMYNSPEAEELGIRDSYDTSDSYTYNQSETSGGPSSEDMVSHARAHARVHAATHAAAIAAAWDN